MEGDVTPSVRTKGAAVFGLMFAIVSSSVFAADIHDMKV
jgi:hypothetical protein